MKGFKIIILTAMGYLFTAQQAFAIDCKSAAGCGQAVPEIDGSGAIIAIGLVVGLAALFREKFFRK